MNQARLIVVLIGILLPFLARVPRGLDWLKQYTNVGLGGFLFFMGFNAIAWGSLVAISYLYHRPESLLVPCLLGFGFLAWAHFSLDLRADAQSAIALPFIPIVALLPIVMGGIVGYVLDRR